MLSFISRVVRGASMYVRRTSDPAHSRVLDERGRESCHMKHHEAQLSKDADSLVLWRGTFGELHQRELVCHSHLRGRYQVLRSGLGSRD